MGREAEVSWRVPQSYRHRATHPNEPLPCPPLLPPALSPPACQVHLPSKESRRRGGLGTAPPSPAAQSRASPRIMAAASARLSPVSSGRSGFSGCVWRSLELPWTLPWDLKEKEPAVRAGDLRGGVPRDQITAPGWGRKAGGSHSTSEGALPSEGAPPGHNHRHTHAGHTLRVTLCWQCLLCYHVTSFLNRLPSPPLHTLTFIHSQTLCAHTVPAWDWGLSDSGRPSQGPQMGRGRVPTRSPVLWVRSLQRTPSAMSKTSPSQEGDGRRVDPEPGLWRWPCTHRGPWRYS